MTARPVRAVAAAAKILRHIKDHPEGLGVTHVSRKSQLSKSTVHGIIKTLEGEGFLVEVDDTRRYRLGGALLELADALRAERPSLAVIRPHLDALAREIGLACFIAAPYSENEFLILEKSESARAIRVTVSVGERFPLTAGALGKAYLAWQPTDRALEIIERVGLPVRTRTSIRATAPYLAELDRVRAEGFAECHGEYDPRTHALAAPVFDAAGDAVLVLLTVGFPSDLDDHIMARHGKTLRAVADRVTHALGGDARTAAPRAPRREMLEARSVSFTGGRDARHAGD
jgi:IclR family KDG regulon transcriptional repressor